MILKSRKQAVSCRVAYVIYFFGFWDPILLPLMKPKEYMDGCQDYDPFLGPPSTLGAVLYLGSPKNDLFFDNRPSYESVSISTYI